MVGATGMGQVLFCHLFLQATWELPSVLHIVNRPSQVRILLVSIYFNPKNVISDS